MQYNGPGYPSGGVWAADSASIPAEQGGSAATESAGDGAAVENHSVYLFCLNVSNFMNLNINRRLGIANVIHWLFY